MANSHQTSKDTSLGVQEQITHLKELLQRKQDNWAEVCDVEAVEADESKRRQQKSAYDLDRLIEQLSKVVFEEEEARVSKIEESINTGKFTLGHATILSLKTYSLYSRKYDGFSGVHLRGDPSRAHERPYDSETGCVS